MVPEFVVKDYSHDVFISYSHRDKQWVDSVLVPNLRSNGLRVLTDDDFVVGISAIENMSNAVKQSKRTLVVLTPDWVASEWTSYEGFLTTYVDPSGKAQRIIPVLLKACTPPDWIGFRTRTGVDLPGGGQGQRGLTAVPTPHHVIATRVVAGITPGNCETRYIRPVVRAVGMSAQHHRRPP